MNSDVKTARRALLALWTAMSVTPALLASNAIANDQVRTETVRFQDLNVNTISGVEALYGRLRSAAQRVCSESNRMQQARASACVEKAEAQAIATLNLPLLTAFYRSKTSGHTQALSANR